MIPHDAAFKSLNALEQVRDLVISGFAPEKTSNPRSEIEAVRNELEFIATINPSEPIRNTVSSLLRTLAHLSALIPLHEEAKELIVKIEGIQKLVDLAFAEAEASAQEVERDLEEITLKA